MGVKVLKVVTNFDDVASLAEGFVERVDDGRLMLYSASPVDEGADLEFEVILSDGSVAMTGRGNAVGSFDGGPERPDDARFDVVIDSLELDDMSSIVYDRILMMQTGSITGEMNVADMPAAEGSLDADYENEPTRVAPEVDVDVAISAPPLEPDFEDEPQTAVRDYEDVHQEATAAASASLPVIHPASERAPRSAPPAEAAPWGGLEPVASEPPPPPAPPPPGARVGGRTQAFEAWDDSVGDVEPEFVEVRGPSVRPASIPPEEDFYADESVPSASALARSEAPPAFVQEAERVPSVAPGAGPGAAWEHDVAARAREDANVLAPVPGAPAEPAGFSVRHIPESGHALLRPSSATALDAAKLIERRAPGAASGRFQYSAGSLPVPAAPPMPGAVEEEPEQDIAAFAAQSVDARASFASVDAADLLEDEGGE